MSKMIKDMIATSLKNRYSEMESALWIEFVGVDGLATTEFRRGLRAKKMRMEIVKTALFRRAMSDTKLAKLGEAASGPVAIVTGGDSVVEVAKFVEEWAPKLKGLKLRAAVIEGEFVPESQIAGLSKMATRADLQAKVAACVKSPGAKLASAILAGGSNIAGCLKALIEKLEKGEIAAAPAAA
jgi:ribosomal protein L10